MEEPSHQTLLLTHAPRGLCVRAPMHMGKPWDNALQVQSEDSENLIQFRKDCFLSASKMILAKQSFIDNDITSFTINFFI